MTRALVVFESMFGNTATIAQAIADGLSGGADVDVVEVGVAPTVIADDVSPLVVGGPTHAFGMSRPSSRRSAAQQADHGVVSRGIGLREWLAARGAGGWWLRPAGPVLRLIARAVVPGVVDGGEDHAVRDRRRARGRGGEAPHAHDGVGDDGVDDDEVMTMTTTGRPDRRNDGAAGRRLGYLIAIVVNAAFLAVVGNPSTWDLVPFLTEAFADVWPLLRLSLLATIAMNVIYLWYDDQVFRATTQIALSGLALAVTLRLYDVFPFDFTAYDPAWEDGVTTVLVVAIVGTGIGIVVEVVRLARALAPGIAAHR